MLLIFLFIRQNMTQVKACRRWICFPIQSVSNQRSLKRRMTPRYAGYAPERYRMNKENKENQHERFKDREVWGLHHLPLCWACKHIGRGEGPARKTKGKQIISWLCLLGRSCQLRPSDKHCVDDISDYYKKWRHDACQTPREISTQVTFSHIQTKYLYK